MGTCFSRLKARKRTKMRHQCTQRSFYQRDKEIVEFEFLVDVNENTEAEVPQVRPNVTEQKLFNKFFPWRRSESTKDLLLTAVMTNTDDESDEKHPWIEPENNKHSGTEEDRNVLSQKLKKGQPLDARGLTNIASNASISALAWRKVSCASATPPSSVDLEWEHEGGIATQSNTSLAGRHLLSLTEDVSNDSGTGNEGSPVESLEWDSCEGVLDADTEQLLSEIERLTARALKETGGDWANR